MNRPMAEKRHNDVKKAIRKRKIIRERWQMDLYNNLHQYSKNKIHCSCPDCSPKTNNGDFYKSRGRIKGRNLKYHDLKAWERMKQSEQEYQAA